MGALMVYAYIVQELKESSKSNSAKSKNWTVRFLAARLVSIFLLFRYFEKSRAVSTRQGPYIVLGIIKKDIDDVLTHVRNDQALQATKSARTSLDFQSTGTREMMDRIWYTTKIHVVFSVHARYAFARVRLYSDKTIGQR